MLRHLLIPALALALAGCERSASFPPPPELDLSAADPDVASLLRDLRAAVERSPSDAGARARYALACDLYAYQGAALAAYDQAARLDPADGRWPYHAARMRADLGDLEGAVTSITVAARLSPDHPPVHWRRGQWLLDLGRLEEADAAFRAALDIDGASIVARAGLARTQIARGETRDAVAVLQDLVMRYPREAYFHQLFARALRAEGQVERARLEAALAANPREPLWPDPWMGDREEFRIGFAATFQRAIGETESGNYDVAIAIMEELRAKRPDDVTVAVNLGAAYLTTRRTDEGIAVFESALRHHPDHFAIHLNLSHAYVTKADGEKALHHAERAVESNPAVPDTWSQNGAVLIALGRQEEAVRVFREAQVRDARAPFPYLAAGSALADLGRFEEAIPEFRAALARDPRSPAAWLGVAGVWAEIGNFAAADSALERAVRLAGNTPRVTASRRYIEELKKR